MLEINQRGWLQSTTILYMTRLQLTSSLIQMNLDFVQSQLWKYERYFSPVLQTRVQEKTNYI